VTPGIRKRAYRDNDVTIVTSPLSYPKSPRLPNLLVVILSFVPLVLVPVGFGPDRMDALGGVGEVGYVDPAVGFWAELAVILASSPVVAHAVGMTDGRAAADGSSGDRSPVGRGAPSG
jgi:hypothetical protein